MIFLSVDKGQEFIVQSPSARFHNMANGMTEKEEVPGKSIRFSPLTQKMEWPLRRIHGRTEAGGVFNSDDATARPGLSKKEAEDYLLNSRKYGVSVVGYGPNGKIWGSNEDSIPLDRILVPSGDGLFCKLCNQQLAKRGAHNHPKSKQHIANLEALEEDQLEAILGAG